MASAAPAAAGDAGAPSQSPSAAAAPGAPPSAPAGETGATGPDAAAGAGGAPPDEGAPPEDGSSEDNSFGLVVDPSAAFDAAREAARGLHDALGTLQAAKADTTGGGDGSEVLAKTAREMQLQLLALRRAHRAMATAADMGRAAEAAAWRKADTEHAHLETRRYESTCCRAAARRWRNFPTPQLTKLRPSLEGFDEEEDDDDVDEGDDRDDNGNPKGLAACLEAERLERARLASELETLDRQKVKDLEAFRECERRTTQLTSRLSDVERALEPVCNLIDLKPRSAGVAPLPDSGILAQMPTPLRLIFSKFDALAAFGPQRGVSVRVEVPEVARDEVGPGPPPEKRPRVEAAADGGASSKTPSAPGAAVAVCVEIALDGAGAEKALVLRFTSPGPSAASVAVEGGSDGSASLLDGLWPEEEEAQGAALGTAAGAAPGARPAGSRAYAWLQVLAGVRERALSAAPALIMAGGVTASDVVQRVRARAAGKAVE